MGISNSLRIINLYILKFFINIIQFYSCLLSKAKKIFNEAFLVFTFNSAHKPKDLQKTEKGSRSYKEPDCAQERLYNATINFYATVYKNIHPNQSNFKQYFDQKSFC